MADSIVHRGPDDEGFYFSGQVGLGFRRLSIIDLGGGHQPLCNEDESVWIVFNGEIYNYQELRQFLLSKGHQFRTQSDTEVIVHLYEELGEACLERLRGMFAFAIWDNRRKSLFIARDRVGIKPLYYYHSSSSFIFGSEIKVILADPEVTPEVNPEMIDRILTFNYLPGEETLLKNIHKLAPGSCVLIQDGDVKIRQYWDLQVPQSSLSLAAAEEQLSAMLDESVRLHMISDVPVGFLLSGGVDSSAMLCMARGKTDGPLLSFTVGFSEPGITDERPYARLAAKAYGAEHHEMTISSKDFENFLPQYIWHMEEPVCEPPAVAMYYVSQLARKFVKVLISGEGGDEGFGGYQIYRNLLWLERLKSVLKPMNGIVSKGLLRLNPYLKSSQIARYAPLLNIPFESYYHSGTSNPLNFFNQNLDTLYSEEFAPHLNRQRSVNIVKQHLQNAGTGTSSIGCSTSIRRRGWWKTLAESRQNDHGELHRASRSLSGPQGTRVCRFAPGKIQSPWIHDEIDSQESSRNRVPQEILNRKKVGFPVPYNAWLRTDLKDWVRDPATGPRDRGARLFQEKLHRAPDLATRPRWFLLQRDIFTRDLGPMAPGILRGQEAPSRQNAFDPAPVI